MPKKKVEEMPKFVDALREVADAKGLSDEQVITALEEAIQRAYIKYLGGGDDAVVSCHVDPETGHVDLAQIKKVVEEVQDDYLEISVEDANATVKGKKSKYAPGDDFAIPCPLEQVTKLTAMAVKSNLRQRLAEAERTALYEVYKDHIGEMMTGTVVKADDRGVTIRIGRTYIEMGRRELIGDEYFKIDEPIKVYIQEVRSVLNEEGRSRPPALPKASSRDSSRKKSTKSMMAPSSSRRSPARLASVPRLPSPPTMKMSTLPAPASARAVSASRRSSPS